MSSNDVTGYLLQRGLLPFVFAVKIGTRYTLYINENKLKGH